MRFPRRARGIDVLIADTAGRLPTQLHLMEEIKKVKRVLGKALPGAPHEVLLVLDANTGQNGLAQVKAFVAWLLKEAEAHERVMVVEVMGRYAGWIALQGGMAGGADVILMPEIPFDLEKVAAAIRRRESFGAKFSIVVVAEGAKPVGGEVTLREAARAGYVERLGGVGIVIAEQLEDMTGREARCVILGHLQRGGGPTAFDRVLATRFGGAAVELIRRGVFGKMVANNPPDILQIPLADVVGRIKTVPIDSDLIKTARAIGVAFGD